VKETFVKLAIVAAAFAILVSSAAAPSALPAHAEIRAALEDWMTQFNAGNSGAVCDLFARDLISNYQGQPERGYDSLCALLHKSLQDKKRAYHYSLNIREIVVSGHLAAVRLVWTLRVEQKSPPRTQAVVEPGLDIFRRQADGRWKISRFIAYAQ
jgi:ketosteroid isomerase-like protein